MNKEETEILDFWFGKSRDEYKNRLWWHQTFNIENSKKQEADPYITSKWKNVLEQIDLKVETDEKTLGTQSIHYLASLLILLDQFPRHIYRGTKKSYVFDSYALKVAKYIHEKYIKTNLVVPLSYKLFVYVCFMHSEKIQDVSEATFELLKLSKQNDLKEPWKSGITKTYKVAKQHFDTLKKFNRYPHRNSILQRESTLEETQFLNSKNNPLWMNTVHKEKDTNVNKLKILVLHSNRQTANSFKLKTDKYLGKKLSQIADLTFCNAPHIYQPSGEAKQKQFDKNPNTEKKTLVWWNATDDPKTMIYNGLEQSLQYINSFFKIDHYDGIIGFSQGGALAALIASLVHDYRKNNIKSSVIENIVEKLQFVVIISGFYCRDTRPQYSKSFLESIPEHHSPQLVQIRKDLIEIPSFHTWGKEDILVNPWRSQKLSEAFKAPQIVTHTSGHFAKAIKVWPVNEMMQFLKGFTKPKPAKEELDMTKIHKYDEKTLHHFCVSDSLNWKKLIDYDTNHHKENPLFRSKLVHLIASHLKNEYVQFIIKKEPGIPSNLVLYAPRYNTTMKKTRLYYDVSSCLASMLNIFEQKSSLDCTIDRTISYVQYQKVLSLLTKKIKESTQEQKFNVFQQEHRNREKGKTLDELVKEPISEYILKPRAEPVDVSNPNMFSEMHHFLRNKNQKTDMKTNIIFEKGTLCSDKRLDLCKQVVGSIGIADLMKTLEIDSKSNDPKVEHLLLGNNICGNQLGFAIAEFIKSGASALTTWYIAGNNLDAKGIAPVCDVLCLDKQVKQLWLKRNPLFQESVPHFVKLLQLNNYLKVLDLTNTGLFDEGVTMLLNGISGKNQTLEFMYLGANGLTEKSCLTISNVLHTVNLKQLALGCNRLGCNGAAYLSKALEHEKCKLQSLEIASCAIGEKGAKSISDALQKNKSLMVLNFGFLKSTKDLKEVPNLFGSKGAMHLANMLSINKTLRSLDIIYTNIQQPGVEAIAQVFSSNSNTTLIHLNLEQFGIPHNELSRELIRKSIEKNRSLLTEQELRQIHFVITPPHLEEIKSVYRVQ